MKMKKMRIIGDSQDGKMLEHVITTLNFLEQDNRNFNTSHIFLIGISQDVYLQFYPEHHSDDWIKARQAIIFIYNENNSWTIRHISEDYEVHKQYIGRKGYRICISDWIHTELCLYQGTSWIVKRPLNCNNFTQELKGIWADYRQLL